VDVVADFGVTTAAIVTVFVFHELLESVPSQHLVLLMITLVFLYKIQIEDIVVFLYKIQIEDIAVLLYKIQIEDIVVFLYKIQIEDIVVFLYKIQIEDIVVLLYKIQIEDIVVFFLAFDFCRFCVVIRFFHPRDNGQ